MLRKIMVMFPPCFILLTAFALTVRAQVRVIPFGRDGQVRYDLDKGTYDVLVNGKTIIKEAYALCKPGDSKVDSRSYSSRTWSTDPVSDLLGTGVCYKVSLSGGEGLPPPMQQLFYVYTGDSHFYTELRLAVAGCNYMSPLTTGTADISGTCDKRTPGDNRALLVPFDNDAWVRYNAMPLAGADLTSGEVTALYNNSSRQGLVLGSVDHTDWKSGIRLKGADSGRLSLLSVFAGYTDKTYTHDTKAHGQVEAGKDGFCRSPRILVGWFGDWRDGLEQYGIANRKAIARYIAPWTKGKPFGWNSWGAMQTKLTLPKAEAVVDFFHDSCPAFRTGDNTLYIDLDSYWDLLVKNGDFSQLTAFCSYCTRKGFQPGIYWAPFVDWGKAARKMEGSAYNYEDCWIKQDGWYIDLDGARAIDPTHPGTRARIAYMIGKFKECGFKMIKIDFLGHATLEADHFFDPSVHTGMQAFRKGMEWLVDQLNGKMLVYAAISPNLATARYVHMRRIACDAFNKIDETAYTLNSTTYGWWQDKIYDYADADHVVFRDGPEGANRARLLSAIVTGTLITGDDYSVEGAWHATAERFLQNKALLEIARSRGGFRPVEGNTGDQPGNFFIAREKKKAWLVIVNYNDKALRYTIDPGRWNIPSHGSMKELFTGASLQLSGPLTVTVPPADAVIYRME